MVRLEGVESFFATYLQNSTEGTSAVGGTIFSFGTTIQLSPDVSNGRFQQKLPE